MSEKKLTGKEKEFCSRYALGGDGVLAATQAGFGSLSEKISQKLLSREDIACEIERICLLRRRLSSQLAAVGYERLAFGSIADAVKLLYMDNPSEEELEKMDLFSVSEIKRPKDGSMEIKFFNRFEALEKLREGAKQESGAPPVYDAIVAGALALRDPKGEGE